MPKTNKILTKWRKLTYDVCGNEKDGFDVNDVYSHGEIELELEVKQHNELTPQVFESASISDAQLRNIFNLGKKQINVDGDGLLYYVNLARNGYPVGELRCESHEGLSPIREKKV